MGGLEMKADDGSVGCRKGEVAAFLEQKLCSYLSTAVLILQAITHSSPQAARTVH